MIPNDKAFNGKSHFEYNGKVFQRWYSIDKKGDFNLKFQVVSVNSTTEQGIALFFSHFNGSIFLNGKPLKVLKGFKNYLFRYEDICNNGLVLSLHVENGGVFFGNASKDNSFDIFRIGSLGCAFWVEEITPNCFRFHCNDHEYDDDFDDFVFDMIYC